MGFKDIVERLDKYQKRLTEGKAEKIQLHHIEKAIEKLTAKKVQIKEELRETTKPEKRKRLEEKMSTIHAQIEKAEWVAKEI